MENTTQNKLKFFAQYFGQRVLKNEKFPIKTILDGHFFFYSIPHIDDYYIELRSIDSITNDECVEVYDLLFDFKSSDYMFAKIDRIKFMIGCENYSLILIDFLRSKGFLVPFMNLTTDQILEFGWAKIKDNG